MKASTLLIVLVALTPQGSAARTLKQVTPTPFSSSLFAPSPVTDELAGLAAQALGVTSIFNPFNWVRVVYEDELVFGCSGISTITQQMVWLTPVTLLSMYSIHWPPIRLTLAPLAYQQLPTTSWQVCFPSCRVVLWCLHLAEGCSNCRLRFVLTA